MARRDYRDLLRQMEQDMQRFTEEAFLSFYDSPTSYSRFWQPAADVHETESSVVIKLELAGVSTESVNVALSGDGRRLVVSGARSEDHAERTARTGCHQLEIYFGPFERTFHLPPEMLIDRDAITATLKDGFLTITLPRRERQNLAARTIPIAIED
jgi:HSP20 family protein